MFLKCVCTGNLLLSDLSMCMSSLLGNIFGVCRSVHSCVYCVLSTSQLVTSSQTCCSDASMHNPNDLSWQVDLKEHFLRPLAVCFVCIVDVCFCACVWVRVCVRR